jgi:uncharacterized membrane protein YeaQ/YmgE (transglycosylase-associated protein family)
MDKSTFAELLESVNEALEHDACGSFRCPIPGGRPLPPTGLRLQDGPGWPDYANWRNTMNLILTLVIGGVVGWLASIVMKTNAQMGLVYNVVVGIVGSFLGFWLAGLIGMFPATGFARLLIALAGAVVLILILKKLKVLK